MPYVGEVTSSPADDQNAQVYGSTFSHEDETAKAGFYKVTLSNGVTTELTAALRSGAARFTYPGGKPAVMLIRTANSETGSSDAQLKIDAANGIVSGSVTSGNFCGYIGTADRHSYYTLYFIAHFDAPIAARQRPTAARPTAQKVSYPRAKVPVDGSCSTPRGQRLWVFASASRT
jgi:putative alpha-1,2-mannosidase